MDIINKTGKPLKIPLPGGKKLFLGPGKTGQVTQKALERPALVKLLEDGDIEIASESSKPKDGGNAAVGTGPSARRAGTGAMRQSGDR